MSRTDRLDRAREHSTPNTPTTSAEERGAPVAALRLGRRPFLQVAAAGAAGLLMAPHLALAEGDEPAATSGTYRVGVGNSSDPYGATQRAVTSCGEWPPTDLTGRTVVIKPNLVMAKPSTSGATTDPQVVRALVDLALAGGASSVLIVEGGVGQKAPPFAACGYSFFSSYDPQGRVQIVDLATKPITLAPVHTGLAYRALYVPSLMLDPNVVFISAAKLKCHVNAGATLSMKNLFGLAAPAAYRAQGQVLPRYDLHARSVDESIIDINKVRPVDFAVVDGIWGMEGNGPLSGTPVQANLAVAGRNAVAVDRICLQAMGLPAAVVPHLAYAAVMGLGPADTSTTQVLGDAFTPYSFTPAQTPPVVWYPSATPSIFSLSTSQQTTISYSTPAACQTRLEIIKDVDTSPAITVVRTLHDWAPHAAGAENVQWDGRDDTGATVVPGLYQTRVLARYNQGTQVGHTVGWVGVSP